MSADLTDLFTFLEDDGIEVPGLKSTTYPEGKTYTIPSPDAETGARLTALAELAAKVNKGIEVAERDVARLRLNDEEEREFAAQVLGSALVEMQADGVSWVRIQRLTQYAFTAFAVGRDAADKAAADGAFSGKAQARPNRAARRAAPTPAARKAPTASTGSSRAARSKAAG